MSVILKCGVTAVLYDKTLAYAIEVVKMLLRSYEVYSHSFHRGIGCSGFLPFDLRFKELNIKCESTSNLDISTNTHATNILLLTISILLYLEYHKAVFLARFGTT